MRRYMAFSAKSHCCYDYVDNVSNIRANKVKEEQIKAGIMQYDLYSIGVAYICHG